MDISMLDAYCERWALANPQLIADTPTGRTYRVGYRGGPAALKLLTDAGVRYGSSGAIALQQFGGHRAVRLFAHDERAHLLEWVEGPMLQALVEQGRDVRATEIIAGILETLHDAEPPPDPDALLELDRCFAALLDRDRGPEHPDLFDRARAITEDLLANQTEPQLLHGDMHHANVLHSRRRGWLALDPKGVWGERTFDAANTLVSPDIPSVVVDEQRYLRTLEILTTRLRLERERLIAFSFAYCCLAATWAIEAGHDASRPLAVARIAEPHLPPPY